MDWEAAILSHARWKRRLHACMADEERLDPEVVGAEDRCELGRWIAAEAARLQGQAHFQSLRCAHAAFHRAAAEVVHRIHAGRPDEAHRLMGFDSAFAQHSRQVVEAIDRLREQLPRP